MADAQLQIDLNGFTIAEVMDIEDVAGMPLAQIFDKGMPAKALAAMVWVVRRRDDPAYTLERAKAETKWGEWKFGGAPDPQPPAIGGSPGSD